MSPEGTFWASSSFTAAPAALALQDSPYKSWLYPRPGGRLNCKSPLREARAQQGGTPPPACRPVVGLDESLSASPEPLSYSSPSCRPTSGDPLTATAQKPAERPDAGGVRLRHPHGVGVPREGASGLAQYAPFACCQRGRFLGARCAIHPQVANARHNAVGCANTARSSG